MLLASFRRPAARKLWIVALAVLLVGGVLFFATRRHGAEMKSAFVPRGGRPAAPDRRPVSQCHP